MNKNEFDNVKREICSTSLLGAFNVLTSLCKNMDIQSIVNHFGADNIKHVEVVCTTCNYMCLKMKVSDRHEQLHNLYVFVVVNGCEYHFDYEDTIKSVEPCDENYISIYLRKGVILKKKVSDIVQVISNGGSIYQMQ